MISSKVNRDNNRPTFSAYITYSNETESSLAILTLENSIIDNHLIKASYGTTKYCSNFSYMLIVLLNFFFTSSTLLLKLFLFFKIDFLGSFGLFSLFSIVILSSTNPSGTSIFLLFF